MVKSEFLSVFIGVNPWLKLKPGLRTGGWEQAAGGGGSQRLEAEFEGRGIGLIMEVEAGERDEEGVGDEGITADTGDGGGSGVIMEGGAFDFGGA